jgi:predicted phosphodiesterase
VTVRIAVMSDLHLEFDESLSFIDTLDPTGVDAIVLAGDIASGRWLRSALAAFCAKYPAVLFVPGNHEHYGVTLTELHGRIRGVRADHPNFHWLRRNEVVIDGVRFAGTTGWPHPDVIIDEGRMPGNEWLPCEHEEDMRYLRGLAASRRADVIVTHVQPAWRAVAPRWVADPLTPYFCLQMDEEVAASGARLWVAGHTHDAWDGFVGETRLVLNPRGYPGETHARRNFRPELVVEVEPRRHQPVLPSKEER